MINNNKINCNLCGGTSELKYVSFPGYQEPNVFDIYHCHDCNTAFSLPVVFDTKSIYDSIYENQKSIPGYKRYWEYYNSVDNSSHPLDFLAKSEDTYWGVKTALESFVKNKSEIKILEVGSGLGYLTYSLNQANYGTVGLDISTVAVQKAKDKFGDYYVADDVFEFAKKHANEFDVVILTEVIEHVNNPIEFAQSLMELTKTGGKVIMTTPNKSFYPNDIIWESELPPVHFWWFSEDSIAYIAKKLNANVKFVDFTNFSSKHMGSYNLKNLRSNPLRKPILNQEGGVMPFNADSDKLASLIFSIKRMISRAPFSKSLYKYYLSKTNPDIVISKERGFVMCAIFNKN